MYVFVRLAFLERASEGNLAKKKLFYRFLHVSTGHFGENFTNKTCLFITS